MRKIRLSRDVTQEILYLMTGIQLSKISKLERGIFTPTEKEKELLAKALQCSTSELFPDEIKNPQHKSSSK